MTFRFGPFSLDSRTRQLLRDGAEVGLSPKGFQLLLLLVENRSREIFGFSSPARRSRDLSERTRSDGRQGIRLDHSFRLNCFVGPSSKLSTTHTSDRDEYTV